MISGFRIAIYDFMVSNAQIYLFLCESYVKPHPIQVSDHKITGATPPLKI